jgi:hypothetical protein
MATQVAKPSPRSGRSAAREYHGYVVPNSFTHGTSKQRLRWFQEGFKTGEVDKARLLFDLPSEELCLLAGGVLAP